MQQFVSRSRAFLDRYPHQFWLLFWGYIINRASGSMIWPFLTIYMREQLGVPLTTVALLLSIRSAAGFLSTTAVGPLMDRFGRKGMMVGSMLIGVVVLVLMPNANTLEAWAVLIAVYGATMPIFTVGGSAMVADLIEEDRRDSAYALIRMAQNVGIAIGPAVGGFLILIAYSLTYYLTAAVNLVLALLIVLVLAETLPQQAEGEPKRPVAGYLDLLHDRAFLIFCGIFLLVEMVITLVFIMLPVYAKENFGIAENQVGLIITINALMVVFFQYQMTQFTRRFRQLPVMIVGSIIYAIGAATIALGSSFPAFAVSMVIITTAELMTAPTALALVARMSPSEMRARYLGVYTLTFTIGSGIAPLIGGVLNDNLGPDAIWYGGMVMGLAAAVGFFLLLRSGMVQQSAARAAAGEV